MNACRGQLELTARRMADLNDELQELREVKAAVIAYLVVIACDGTPEREAAALERLEETVGVR